MQNNEPNHISFCRQIIEITSSGNAFLLHFHISLPWFRRLKLRVINVIVSTALSISRWNLNKITKLGNANSQNNNVAIRHTLDNVKVLPNLYALKINWIRSKIKVEETNNKKFRKKETEIKTKRKKSFEKEYFCFNEKSI